MSFRVPFKISIISLLLVMIFSLTLSIFIGVWAVSSKTADDVAANLFKATSQNAKGDIKKLLQEAMASASRGAVQPDISRIAYEGITSKNLPTLIENLAQNKALYSLYYGFEDGTFYQIIAVRNSNTIRTKHKAPEQTQWIVRTIVEQQDTTAKTNRIQHWSFLDENQRFIGSYDEIAPAYDPRKRPWYRSALENTGSILSSPYLFSSLKKTGITASKRLSSGAGVFGVDLTLTGLSNEISSLDVSENGGVLLLDNQNHLLANSSALGTYPYFHGASEITNSTIRASLKAQKLDKSGKMQRLTEDGTPFYVSSFQETFPGTSLSIVIAAPETDFKGFISQLQQQLLIISSLSILIFIPLSYIFAARLSNQVIKLSKDAKRFQNMDFSKEKTVQSRIFEFDNLIQSFHQMGQALAIKTKALKIEQDKLSRLVELGIAMSAEKDSNKLMEMVLLGAKELTNADGGTLYTIDDNKKLQFQIVRNDSLNIMMGGTSGNPVEIPPVHLFNDKGEPNISNVASYAVHKAASVNIGDAYNTVNFDFSGTKIFDRNNSYKSQSFLTVPLKPRGGEIIGVLQIINAHDDETGKVIPFAPYVQPFVEALAAQAATALYNRDLLKAQETLMDSFIQLIAGAVDAKSPYTGGHCERVPELAKMLAQEASDVNTGDLADFNFKTKDEWREFEIGAWLHDCGKVTTPEYVVDKATKLETIYNRIHEVRARFEILLRDAEIQYLKSLNENTEPKTALKKFEDQKQTLHDDYSFIAECNIGGEFMSDDKIERVQKLAQTKWTRHFSIQLGLSIEEAKRYVDEPAEPCEESLLTDKSSHIIARERPIADLYQDCDFKIDVPESLYNLGEVYNLSVKRGTLTEEERFKINEHVMQTIVMLEQLPLPKHLERIPEYAGTHHENLAGSGYPRKLEKNDLSIPSRIMAIADVFEALTASDRPYKQPKTLNEAIKILSFFKKDNHIDPVLFDLFLTSGTYLTYAEKFLTEEQIDEVDINRYISN